MERFGKSSYLILWPLILVNVPGLGLFLYFASWDWAPRGQEGLYYEAGDSISWALLAFPFLAICTVVNFIMSPTILTRLFYYGNWGNYPVDIPKHNL